MIDINKTKICLCVAYWPPTRPSCQKKKCTCVNNRCIRSKISGDQGQPWLSRGWIECEIVTPTGSRWTSNYYITPATGSSSYLERRCWNENHVPAQAGPPVEQPRRTGKKGCDSQKSGGSICCCSVQSPTHLSHNNTLRNPFEPFQIKWEVYFSEELCPLVFFIVFSKFLHAYGYVTFAIILNG